MMGRAAVPLRPAVVFFARDFLADEFPRLAARLNGMDRIYITANRREAQRVRSADPHGTVYSLDDTGRWPDLKPEPVNLAHNCDRFLRGYHQCEIEDVLRVLQGISADCLSKFSVKLYLDEPVSGFPNWYFNRAFAAAGARCAHFQTAWLPGYMFYTADAAQAAPVEMGGGADWRSLVDTHVESRREGLARPVYVINYGSARKRLQGVITTTAKGIYRSLFRRDGFYIDRDAAAHWLHAECLLRSFDRRTYSQPPEFNCGERYVLFPLHYEPESVLNYFSEFQRQEEIAAQILDTLPLGYRLILKEHPSQPGALGLNKWRALVRSKRVLALRGDYDARRLLALDVVVVSIGSTLALEAAVAGRPVGVLGAVHFVAMPGIRRLASPTEWMVLLDHSPSPLPEIKAWYARFMKRHCFRGSIMRGATDIDALAESIGMLLRRSDP